MTKYFVFNKFYDFVIFHKIMLLRVKMNKLLLQCLFILGGGNFSKPMKLHGYGWDDNDDILPLNKKQFNMLHTNAPGKLSIMFI